MYSPFTGDKVLLGVPASYYRLYSATQMHESPEMIVKAGCLAREPWITLSTVHELYRPISRLSVP